MYLPIEAWYWPAWARFDGLRIRYDAFTGQTLRVVTPPAQEQITVDEAALHLRLDAYGSPADYPERTWLEAAIAASREVIEWQTGLTLAPQELEVTMRAWPIDCMVQPGVSLLTGPVLGVTSITYVDGVTIPDPVLDPLLYQADTYSMPGYVYPAYNQSWPTAQPSVNSIRIRFTAGYSLPTDSPQDAPLPKSLRAAMLLTLGHLYENREATTTAPNMTQIPLGISSLCEKWRIRTSMA